MVKFSKTRKMLSYSVTPISDFKGSYNERLLKIKRNQLISTNELELKIKLKMMKRIDNPNGKMVKQHVEHYSRYAMNEFEIRTRPSIYTAYMRKVEKGVINPKSYYGKLKRMSKGEMNENGTFVLFDRDRRIPTNSIPVRVYRKREVGNTVQRTT